MFDIRETLEFAAWLSKIKDRATRINISQRIQRLALGNPGDVSSIGEGVSELRIHHGPGYRVYFLRRGAVVIVLLCGGSKKSQDRHL